MATSSWHRQKTFSPNRSLTPRTERPPRRQPFFIGRKELSKRACRLYAHPGFRIVGNGSDETEWVMMREPNEPFPLVETEHLVLRHEQTPTNTPDTPSAFSIWGT